MMISASLQPLTSYIYARARTKYGQPYAAIMWNYAQSSTAGADIAAKTVNFAHKAPIIIPILPNIPF